MPFPSRFPPLDIPDVDLFTYLFSYHDKVSCPPEKVVYEDGTNDSRKYTVADVRQLAVQFGSWLVAERGIQKGDRVAICSLNDIDYLPVLLGIHWAGAAVHPMNPSLTAADLVHQLEDSGATLLVAHPSSLEVVAAACAGAGLQKDTSIVVLGTPPADCPFAHWTSLKTAAASAVPQPVIANPRDDLAFLVYSSGTTGRPKGAMITHYNMIAQIAQGTACECGKLRSIGTLHIDGVPDGPPEGDKILAFLPMFHVYGLAVLVLIPFYNGIHTIVLPRFAVEPVCQLVQKHRITFLYLVPPVALLLAKHPAVPQYDLSSVRMCNSGAAPLGKALQDAVFQRVGIRIKQGYGLTEVSSTSHEQKWEDWQAKTGSIGRLQPGMSAMICQVGEDGAADEQDGPGAAKELGVGETGELYMKGPNVFKGYWRNPAATAACLSADGWFRTGDIGHVDGDGDFYITDRAKELIKYKGFQVAPADLEKLLLTHALVDDAIVVGAHSERQATEVPRAYLVRKGGLAAVQPGDGEQIAAWVAERVASPKQLRGGVHFVESVPKSASGKLLRRLLRDQARKELAAEEAVLPEPARAKL